MNSASGKSTPIDSEMSSIVILYSDSFTSRFIYVKVESLLYKSNILTKEDERSLPSGWPSKTGSDSSSLMNSNIYIHVIRKRLY